MKRRFQGFRGGKQDPALILNRRHLTLERIHVAADGMTAEGQWAQMQPRLFSDGTAMLRSSRLNNSFRRCEEGTWRFTRNRTENVFVAPPRATWASTYPPKSVLMKP